MLIKVFESKFNIELSQNFIEEDYILPFELCDKGIDEYFLNQELEKQETKKTFFTEKVSQTHSVSISRCGDLITTFHYSLPPIRYTDLSL